MIKEYSSVFRRKNQPVADRTGWDKYEENYTKASFALMFSETI